MAVTTCPSTTTLSPTVGVWRCACSTKRACNQTTSAALVPRPRLHLIRFHGVLAPNAKLRSLVVPQGPPKDEEPASEAAAAAKCEIEAVEAPVQRISCARLLKRVFDIDMQHCPNCGAGELKIIAAILERPVIEKILSHLGLAAQPPPKGRVREAELHFAA